MYFKWFVHVYISIIFHVFQINLQNIKTYQIYETTLLKKCLKIHHFSLLRHVNCTQNGNICFYAVFLQFTDDGYLRAETCRNFTCDIIIWICRIKVCEFCWFSSWICIIVIYSFTDWLTDWYETYSSTFYLPFWVILLSFFICHILSSRNIKNSMFIKLHRKILFLSFIPSNFIIRRKAIILLHNATSEKTAPILNSNNLATSLSFIRDVPVFDFVPETCYAIQSLLLL
jgi:hypothetical protein